jgi:sugar-specific transcriptional regulator TrmB
MLLSENKNMATERLRGVEPAALALTALGFSELEALAYLFLLRGSPATGYRVARGVGRTAANIYNTLESLEARGAVMLEQGEPKVYRAVPPDELLGAMEASFATRRAQADLALKSLEARSSDERVYRLSTPEQVFERCRTVLRTAVHVVLLDAFPGPLQVLLPELQAAADRGVRVAVQAYQPVLLPGVEVVLSYQSDAVRSRWAGEWINVVGDALVQVQALLEPGCGAVRTPPGATAPSWPSSITRACWAN